MNLSDIRTIRQNLHHTFGDGPLTSHRLIQSVLKAWGLHQNLAAARLLSFLLNGLTRQDVETLLDEAEKAERGRRALLKKAKKRQNMTSKARESEIWA